MQEIINRPWEYILYEQENTYTLSVVCGSVATFILNIRLSDQETNQYKSLGESYIASLAAKIQHSPDSHKMRHIDINLPPSQ